MAKTKEKKATEKNKTNEVSETNKAQKVKELQGKEQMPDTMTDSKEQTDSTLKTNTKSRLGEDDSQKSHAQVRKEKKKLEWETRLLRSAAAERAMGSVIRAAKETERILTEGTLSSGEKALRNLYDRFAQNYAFLTLIDTEGLSLIHTDRLREGVLFDDKVGLRAARTNMPITQIYYRDTGEVMIDATAPVFIRGEKVYSLRLGYRVQKSVLWRKIYAATLLPILIPSVIIGIFFSPPVYLIWWPILSGAIAMLTGWWLINMTYTAVKEIERSTQSISRGRLNTFSTPSFQDELGGAVLDINRVNRGLHAIMSLLTNVSRQLNSYSQEQAQATISVSKNTKIISQVMIDFSTNLERQEISIENAIRLEGEINETITQMNGNEFSTVRNTKRATERAEESTQAIENARMEMETIEKIVRKSTQVIHGLEENAKQISKITNSITSIATKTNILALNAAIEASRAGDQGQGFAVVAEEVRQLAEESSASAQEILDIVQETQSRASEAVLSMEKEMSQVRKGTKAMIYTASVIGEMLEAVDETTQLSNKNYDLSMELKDKSNALLKSLEDVGDSAQKLTQEISDVLSAIHEQSTGTNEVASSAGHLAKMAAGINNVIQRFRND